MLAEPYLKGVEAYGTPENPLPEGRWPFTLPVVRDCAKIRFHPGVTFLAGENGSGKSTLLEAIAARWGLNPEGGSRHTKFSTRDSHSPLDDNLRLHRSTERFARDGFFLRAESFYNLSSYEETLPGHPMPKYHRMSHGESFLALVQNRFGDESLLLMDEPEAALSPDRQLVLLSEMERLVQENAQIIVATHSPILLAYPRARIYWLGEDGVEERQWDELDHVRTYRAFFAHRERMLAGIGIKV